MKTTRPPAAAAVQRARDQLKEQMATSSLRQVPPTAPIADESAKDWIMMRPEHMNLILLPLRISCLEWLFVSACTWYMWIKQGKACLIVIASASVHPPRAAIVLAWVDLASVGRRSWLVALTWLVFGGDPAAFGVARTWLLLGSGPSFLAAFAVSVGTAMKSTKAMKATKAAKAMKAMKAMRKPAKAMKSMKAMRKPAKAMKTMKAMKTTKAMRKPAKAMEDLATIELEPLSPHRLGDSGELWELNQVVGGEVICHISVSPNETVRQVVEKAMEPGCDRRALLRPRLAVFVDSGPEKGDDNQKDDDRKSDDDNQKDDDSKSDDDNQKDDDRKSDDDNQKDDDHKGHDSGSDEAERISAASSRDWYNELVQMGKGAFPERG
ncbi:unnamed protein product [Symbiodinium microadriaticum]|nr:unnamed protein product [Symbiodinium microadriaticum]